MGRHGVGGGDGGLCCCRCAWYLHGPGQLGQPPPGCDAVLIQCVDHFERLATISGQWPSAPLPIRDGMERVMVAADRHTGGEDRGKDWGWGQIELHT